MRTMLLRTAIAARVALVHGSPNVGVHGTPPAGTLARVCRKTTCAFVVCLIRSVPV